MKVMLVYPPIDTRLPVQGSFPLGLGYLASSLRRAGHEVSVMDFNMESRRSKKRIAEALRAVGDGYGLVGISGMVTVYDSVKFIAEVVKEVAPKIPVVVGGSVGSSMPEFLLKHTLVDMVAIGEGEQTVVELVDALENDKPVTDVKGLCVKTDSEQIRTAPRPLNDDLDSIPFPAWDLFNMEGYLNHNYMVNSPYKSMNIIAGRGCPYECTFCYRNFGRSARFRSVDNALSEIQELVSRYDVRHFELQDELFTLKDDYVMEFCDKVLEQRLGITWRCLGRANLANYDVFTRMKAAGCHWIGFGIESGSPAMLKRMKKQITPEQAARAIELAREAGINASGTFIMGLPGETRETIRETVDFCKKAKIYNKPFFPVPYPGTALFGELKENGKINDENEESVILQMKQDATHLLFNLTDMPDDDLVRYRDEAEKDILDHLGRRSQLSRFLGALAEAYRVWGLKGSFTLALRLVGKLFSRAAQRIQRKPREC